jgi:hypothetical protein
MEGGWLKRFQNRAYYFIRKFKEKSNDFISRRIVQFPGSGLADDLYGMVHELVLPHVEAPEGHLRRDTLGQAPASTPQKVNLSTLF